MKRFQLGFLTAILCLILLIPGAVLGENDSFTDMVILSTTDMHGKCWPINLLTEEKVTENMLGVSTAVRQIRGTYGKEQVILIDNGDLFQGTPISETQIKARIAGENSDPLVMAMCLREIGYDAFVLGNHEFNYDWNLMSDTYRYLEDNGVPVLAANVIWDGSDGIHEAGTNAFTPYLVRSVMVGGHEHKIGILGLENTDVPIWDLPVRYPGLMFAHPGNSNRSLSQEARPYVEEMRTAGCEFIIVSYHGGLGAADKPLVYRVNSDQQGMRLIKETEGINMVIMGHDHYSGYSGNVYRDAAGKDVLVVNGGVIGAGPQLGHVGDHVGQVVGGHPQLELLGVGAGGDTHHVHVHARHLAGLLERPVVCVLVGHIVGGVVGEADPHGECEVGIIREQGQIIGVIRGDQPARLGRSFLCRGLFSGGSRLFGGSSSLFRSRRFCGFLSGGGALFSGGGGFLGAGRGGLRRGRRSSGASAGAQDAGDHGQAEQQGKQFLSFHS